MVVLKVKNPNKSSSTFIMFAKIMRICQGSGNQQKEVINARKNRIKKVKEQITLLNLKVLQKKG